MATVAKTGIGAYFQRWNTDVGTTTGFWETLAEVTHIGWGGISRNVVETFKLNNADDYVNKLQGILNAGSITLTINYSQAEFVNLKADAENRGNIEYQIVFPDGEGLEFAGFVVELPIDFGSDDVMAGDVVIEIDGKPDFVTTANVTTPA